MDKSMGALAELVEDASSSVVGLDHIALAVPDLERAIEWYQDVLGFRLLERRITRGAKTGMISAVVQSRSAIVVLVQGTEPESQVTRFIDHFGPGVQHVALEVDDLDFALERVHKAGWNLETPVLVDTGIRQAFLRRDGASGVRIELIERRGGVFSDNSVERLFRALEDGNLF